MGPGLPFLQNCHWKHLLEKFSIPHTNSTGNRTWIALLSSSKWRSQGSGYCNSVHLRLLVDAVLSGNTDYPQTIFCQFSHRKTLDLKSMKYLEWNSAKACSLYAFFGFWMSIHVKLVCRCFAFWSWPCENICEMIIADDGIHDRICRKDPLFIPVLPALHCNQLWLEGKTRLT